MKRILVVGAGYLQSFIIKRAVELGYEVHAIDGSETAIGLILAHHSAVINIVDKEASLKYAKEKDIDGVITAATDFGVITTSYIAEQLGLKCINLKTAELIKNKYLVRKKLFENHVDDSDQAYEVNNSTNFDALSTKIKYPVMVKPCDGSGSRGACRVNDASNLKSACINAINNSITHRAEIETFLIGQEYGVESFILDNELISCIVMKKWMTNPPYYAELGHAYPSGLSSSMEAKIKHCVAKALSVLGVNHGPVNMDIIVTPEDSVHIIDIGARMGGNLIGSHILPDGAGIMHMDNIIKASVGDCVSIESHESRPIASKLMALTPGIVKQLPDFKRIAESYDVRIFHHLKIGDMITSYRTNLDGCGYILAYGVDINEASNRAQMALLNIDKNIIRK